MKAIFDAIRCERNKNFVSSSQGIPFKDFELATRGFQNRLNEVATKTAATVQNGQYPWDVLECKILQQTQKLLGGIVSSKPITDDAFDQACLNILHQPDDTGLLKVAMKSIIYRSSYAILHGLIPLKMKLPSDVTICNINITECAGIIEIEFTFRKRLLEYSKDIFKKANFCFANPQKYSLYECASILKHLGSELDEFIKGFNGEFIVTLDELHGIAKNDLDTKMRNFVNTLSTEQRDMLKGDFDQLLDLL